MPQNNKLKLVEQNENSPVMARLQVVASGVAAMHAAFAQQATVVNQPGLPPDVFGVADAYGQHPSQISGIPLPVTETPLAEVIPLTPGIVGATVEHSQANPSVTPEAA